MPHSSTKLPLPSYVIKYLYYLVTGNEHTAAIITSEIYKYWYFFQQNSTSKITWKFIHSLFRLRVCWNFISKWFTWNLSKNVHCMTGSIYYFEHLELLKPGSFLNCQYLYNTALTLFSNSRCLWHCSTKHVDVSVTSPSHFEVQPPQWFVSLLSGNLRHWSVPI